MPLRLVALRHGEVLGMTCCKQMLFNGFRVAFNLMCGRLLHVVRS